MSTDGPQNNRRRHAASASAAADVTDLEIRLVLEAIHAQYGYDLRGYSAPFMRRRVLAVLAKSRLEHLGALQHRLLTDPAFFAAALSDLTVRTSEMFRDPAVFKVLREQVVPHLRTYPLLKIWHAGCGAGEEVYAMAILLTEEGLYERTQIYATDLNPHALELAKQGVYAGRAIDAARANHARSGGTSAFDAHATLAFDNMALRASLRRNILFFQHDLVSDQVFGEMHVVFCRNVLIYFGAELRRAVLTKLAASLCPGGFLCLGKSERLDVAEPVAPFVPFAPHARIYRHGS